MAVYCLIVSTKNTTHPRATSFLTAAHDLGLTNLQELDLQDLYFLEGQLSTADLQRLAEELLADHVDQTCEWRALKRVSPHRRDGQIVEVALRAGLADPVAEKIARYAKKLGIEGVKRSATGQRFTLQGETRLTDAELHAIARRLLANPVIQRYELGCIEPTFPTSAQASEQVEIIPLRGMSTDALAFISEQRRAALDDREMLAIQTYFAGEDRDPTDVEFEMIAQTWSEHCVHKSFRAHISISNPRHDSMTAVNSLLRTTIQAATEKIAAPWVRSAFVDNAGIIDFDDEHELSFKVETHNHPSAIEPFGGANTGVGGVVRDILGVSAKPIAAIDVLCFGPQRLPLTSLPDGVLHPRRILSGVVAGVGDYGNKLGIPTVNGAILYDPGFTANPLVFCGCVGIAPKGSHPRAPQPGDHIIVIGGRTGRDGLRGATFSSMTVDAETSDVASACVQIGDPITEKGLIEVVTRARDLNLYHAITDCGAGGLSSAVGEMAQATGVEVDLSLVQLKYPGLSPWEIWLSEAQERMVLAVSEASLTALQNLCDIYQVEFSDIGRLTTTGRIIARFGEKVVLDIEAQFLFEALPQRRLQAELPPQIDEESRKSLPHVENFNEALLNLLSHPNIASKGEVIRTYDHEVQGGTVVKPLTGACNDGPSDGCAIKPLGTEGTRGIVLSNGINPEYGKYNPYRMALNAVDEAIRNAVAVGADPDHIALLDNFCWGDPLEPKTMGTLVEAARGCHDAAILHHAPFISGKDSLNNEYLDKNGQRLIIPPTLLISAIGIIEDIGLAVTMDLKDAQNAIYLLGETTPEFGGSHLNLVLDHTPPPQSMSVPSLADHTPGLVRALHRAMQAGIVRACHDLSEGGMAVAAAEMCIAGRAGLELDIQSDDPTTALFSESSGRFLVEVRPEHRHEFENCFSRSYSLLCRRIGVVTAASHLKITQAGTSILSLPIHELVTAWQGNLGGQ